MTTVQPGIRIREIIQDMALDKLEIGALNDSLLLRDNLHFDSLSLTLLMFRVQEEFGLSLLDMRKHLVRAQTIGEVVDCVVRLLADAGPPTEPGARTESL